MNKKLKLALIIFFSATLIMLLANFVINYANLLGNNFTYIYNFDDKYNEDFHTFISDKAYISFDYPSNWSHDVITNNNTTTETFTLDENNNISVSYTALDPNIKSSSIDTIIEASYNEMISAYTNNGYTLNDNNVFYKNSTRIRYLNFSNDTSYFNRYSWVTNDNYLCEMLINYEKSEYDNIKLILDSMHFMNPDSLVTYTSIFSNFTFEYPNTYSTLGTFYNNTNNVVSENIIKNANTSITINHFALDNSDQKYFYNTSVKQTESSNTKDLKSLGFTEFKNGTHTIDNTDFKYIYYTNEEEDKFVYTFYWYEMIDDVPIGNSIICRFSKDDLSDINSIMRSASFNSKF